MTESPARNVFLADVLHYAFDHAWPAPAKDIPMVSPEKFGMVEEYFPVLIKAVQDGKLVLWGKAENQSAYEELTPDYWRSFTLDNFSFFNGREALKTKAKAGSPAPGIRYALMTNREQIEKLWT